MERLLADASKISGQKYDISNLNDVYDAIHVIQQEMGVTGTTAKEASSTLLGSFESMKSAATNLLGNLALGQNVNKSMGELVSSASTFLFENLVPTLVNIATSLPDALFGAMKSAMPQFIAKLPQFITEILNAASEMLTNVTGFLDGFYNNLGKDPGATKAGLKIVGKIALALLKGTGQLLLAALKLATTIPRAIIRLLGSLFSGMNATVKKKVSSIVATIKSKFAAAKQAIVSPIRKAKTTLFGIIDKIKNKFKKVTLKLKLKIPKVSLSGGKAPWGIGGKGKLPNFRVRWAAKGGIVDGATLIGAGEKGKEAIVPLDAFWDRLDRTTGAIDYNKLGDAIASALAGVNITSTVNIDGKTVAQTTAPYMNDEINTLQRRNSRKLGYAL